MLALPNDSLLKTLAVAFAVAFLSATVVTITAVTLKPLQLANVEQERQARMQAMIASLPGLSDILRASDGAINVRLVDLDEGSFMAHVDPSTYDQRAAASDPALSRALPREIDIAGIGRRANLAPVYLVQQGQKIELIVLPVHGAGYQSTIYAYLALSGDLKRVAAFTVYQQGETPGLGARIADAGWQALWAGKDIVDEAGAMRISVVRGQASGPHEIDGIAGATRTTAGINNMLRFWMGEHGFGPFLTNLRTGVLSP